MVRSSRNQTLSLGARSLVAVAVAACVSSGPRGAAESTAAGDHSCRFEMLGDRPGTEYEEIAKISLQGDVDFGAGRYRDSRRFATTLREMVCELGGDAVTTEMDARGEIVRAVVFRRRPPSRAADPS